MLQALAGDGVGAPGSPDLALPRCVGEMARRVLPWPGSTSVVSSPPGSQ